MFAVGWERNPETKKMKNNQQPKKKAKIKIRMEKTAQLPKGMGLGNLKPL